VPNRQHQKIKYLQCSNYIFRLATVALALHHHLLYNIDLTAETVTLVQVKSAAMAARETHHLSGLRFVALGLGNQSKLLQHLQ
jgi:hypothetical protein